MELVKRARKRSAAGLVNAVLRKVGRDPMRGRTSPRNFHARLATRKMAPRLRAETAHTMARASLPPPETGSWSGPELPAHSNPRGPGGTGSFRSAALRLPGAGYRFAVHRAPARVAPGHSFLDLCAAPGNKTAQALEAGVHAVACDLH